MPEELGLERLAPPCYIYTHTHVIMHTHTHKKTQFMNTQGSAPMNTLHVIKIVAYFKMFCSFLLGEGGFHKIESYFFPYCCTQIVEFIEGEDKM